MSIGLDKVHTDWSCGLWYTAEDIEACSTFSWKPRCAWNWPRQCMYVYDNIGYWRWRVNLRGSTPHPGGVRRWMKKGWGQTIGWGQCFEFPSMLWHCWLGDKNSIKNSWYLSPEVISQNKWTKKTEWELSNPGSPRKQPLKWTWWWWFPVIVTYDDFPYSISVFEMFQA